MITFKLTAEQVLTLMRAFTEADSAYSSVEMWDDRAHLETLELVIEQQLPSKFWENVES